MPLRIKFEKYFHEIPIYYFSHQLSLIYPSIWSVQNIKLIFIFFEIVNLVDSGNRFTPVEIFCCRFCWKIDILVKVLLTSYECVKIILLEIFWCICNLLFHSACGSYITLFGRLDRGEHICPPYFGSEYQTMPGLG